MVPQCGRTVNISVYFCFDFYLYFCIRFPFCFYFLFLIVFLFRFHCGKKLDKIRSPQGPSLENKTIPPKQKTLLRKINKTKIK
jgi:hypothetical protein